MIYKGKAFGINNRFSLADFLFFTFGVVYLVVHVISENALFANLLIAFVGFLCLLYVIIKKRNDFTPYKLFVMGALLSALMVISYVYNGNANLTNLLWIWAYLGVALLVVLFDISNLTYLCSMLIVSGVFFVEMLTGVDPQDALSMGSGNNISTIIVFFVLLFYYSIWRSLPQRDLPYYPSLICLALSLWGKGRAGLLTSIALLGAIFMYNYLFTHRNKISTLVQLLLVIAASYLVVNRYLGSYIEAFMVKFLRYGTKSIRSEIWIEYIDGSFSNIFNFLFGPHTRDVRYRWLSHYNGNTHNAFLMLHAKYGIFGFICFCVPVGMAVVRSLRKKQFFILLMIGIVVLRSMFDWTAFPGLYDVFFWIFMYWGFTSNVPEQLSTENRRCK